MAVAQWIVMMFMCLKKAKGGTDFYDVGGGGAETYFDEIKNVKGDGHYQLVVDRVFISGRMRWCASS
jgi:hypothetical protein